MADSSASGNTRWETLDECFHAARAGAVVLTSNQRAARLLQREYGRWQRSSGALGWPAPAILTWDNWLHAAWYQVLLSSGSGPLLLSGPQEQSLWGEIIAAQQQASPLSVDALAKLAQQAWTLLLDHNGNSASLRGHTSARLDWQRYSDWSAQFANALRRSNWLTHAELPAHMLRQLQAGVWVPAGRVVLWGFDRLSASQRTLLQALGVAVQVEEMGPVVPANAALLAVPLPEDEFRAAARWAWLRLDQNPEAQLAILTTQVPAERGALSRALSLELAPAQFSFSLGHPLSHAPLVRIALRLLAWPSQALPAAEIADLLLARELCRSEQELRERAVFEFTKFRRRRSAEPALDLAAFTGWLQQQLRRSPSDTMSRFLRQCQACGRSNTGNAVDNTAEQWAVQFLATLAAYDFPAESGDSRQYQTLQRWESLLDQFSTLSLLGERISRSAALERLQKMAGDVTFQPESTNTPVTIMGPLEAAGSVFDGILFLGCTDMRWPIPQATNPLLPASVQRSLGMPGAVRADAFEQARQMTLRILRSAGEVIFSYALHNSEGELRPSPLLFDILPDAVPDRLAELHRPAEQPAPLLEEFFDEPPGSWTSTRGHVPSSVLRSQAACPFQAFALQRLRARGEDLAEEGFDNLQRGQLVHDLLQNVWTGDNGLFTSDALLALIAEGRLEEFVRNKASTLLPDSDAPGWQHQFVAIERERLTTLVCRWLREVEAERPRFQVLASEQEHSFTLLDSLKFQVRIDRLDHVLSPTGDAPAPKEDASGTTVLLDYKTGKLDNKEWQTPRMDQPQLPLYALYALQDANGDTLNPGALAFASLRSDDSPCLKSFSSAPELFPKSKSDPANRESFQRQLAAWRDDIESLAREFVTGNATVRPKHGAKTCRYCELQPLCRVNTQQALLEVEQELNEVGAAEQGFE